MAVFTSYLRYLIQSASDHSLILILILGFALLVVLMLVTFCTVPQHQAFVIERFGKYKKTLEAGVHFLLPFVDRVAYTHTLKEFTMNAMPQICITTDNITVRIDGLVSMFVHDPKLASYGNENFRTAVRQLAQAVVQSEMGKLEFDEIFKNQDYINAQVLSVLRKSSEAWGVKIIRYEISSFDPIQTSTEPLENRLWSERESRAQAPLSEGPMDSDISAPGEQMDEAVRRSEAKALSRIREAEGRAHEIILLANATAEGIARIAREIEKPGGREALKLQVLAHNTIGFAKLQKSVGALVEAGLQGSDEPTSPATTR